MNKRLHDLASRIEAYGAVVAAIGTAIAATASVIKAVDELKQPIKKAVTDVIE